MDLEGAFSGRGEREVAGVEDVGELVPNFGDGRGSATSGRAMNISHEERGLGGKRPEPMEAACLAGREKLSGINERRGKGRVQLEWSLRGEGLLTVCGNDGQIPGWFPVGCRKKLRVPPRSKNNEKRALRLTRESRYRCNLFET